MVKKKVVEKQEISEEKQISKSKFDFSKINYWMVATIVLGVLLIGVVVYNSATTVSSSKAGEMLVNFAASQGVGLSILNVEKQGCFYKIQADIEGQQAPFYITKDGKYFTASVLELEESSEPTTTPTETNTEIPKSDNPTAELFVMTHCPYGTQAEKGFLPIMKLLGSDSNLKIRFVHYYMHTNQQEEVETPRQVCIREEQPSKYNDYLECFLGSTSGSVSEATACEKKVGINSASLKECIDSGRAEEYYTIDSMLSQQYGVQGSPTLVINGVQANSGRSASAYLSTICSADSSPSELCTSSVSATNPSPGFGYSEGSAASTNAQC